MMGWLIDPQAWIALVTLAALEIVLGIDNIIFISILVNRLPEHNRAKARFLGLGLAMLTRIALLLSITWGTCWRATIMERRTRSVASEASCRRVGAWRRTCRS